jgi:hypothetical protein
VLHECRRNPALAGRTRQGGKNDRSAETADRRGKQLAGGQGLDQAVPEELPGQQVLGAQDPALGIEPFDLQADRMPMHPVGQPVGAGDDEGAAGPTGEDFAFLDEELDVFGPGRSAGLRVSRASTHSGWVATASRTQSG